MEVLARTEYQDIYRIVDGVLLIVNKFARIEYPDKLYFHIYESHAKYKSYNKGCQKSLKVLKENYKDEYLGIEVPKGTVIYESRPVMSTEDRSKWRYEIKTTGSCFGGNFYNVKSMLDTIRVIMEDS